MAFADDTPERPRRAGSEVAGSTLCDLLSRNARLFPDVTAQVWPDGGRQRRRTWREYTELVHDAAAGLIDLGVGPGTAVGISMRNVPEHAIADLAAIHAGATPISYYLTFAPSQLTFVAEDSRTTVIVTDAGEPLDRWRIVASELATSVTVVVLGDEADARDGRFLVWEQLIDRGRRRRAGHDPVPARAAAVKPDDPATLVYTSGTTGEPKGVILTHRNILWQSASVQQAFRVRMNPTMVSYLPLAHAAERLTSHYLALHRAATVYFCPDRADLPALLRIARPHFFVAVPRVWEALSACVDVLIADEANPLRARLGRGAVRVAEQGGTAWTRSTATRLLGRVTHRTIRSKLGLDRIEVALSGGAPIAPDILRRFASVGVPIFEVYGMTESTGIVTANVPGDAAIGTVGRPLPGIDVRLADDGEILVRGPNVSPGYRSDRNRWSSGWLQTGDIGAVDDDGRFRIIGRKTELIINSAGKNIAPVGIERRVEREPVIADCCVVGEARTHLVALLTLDAQELEAWYRRSGLSVRPIAEASRDPDVRAVVSAAVERANAAVSRPEQIRNFAVVAEVWESGGAMKTPTGKLRRHKIVDRYAATVDQLYA